jgi:hypothetical protein
MQKRAAEFNQCAGWKEEESIQSTILVAMFEYEISSTGSWVRCLVLNWWHYFDRLCKV